MLSEFAPRVRRPLFGRHGHKVVAGFCLWELVALLPKSRVPTVSKTVTTHKPFGYVLLGMLAHHWYLELPQEIQLARIADAMESLAESSVLSA